MSDSHDHDQGHSHDHAVEGDSALSRRGLLKGLGLAAGASALAPLGAEPAGATTRVEAGQKVTNAWKPQRYQLSGDHHIHTHYSNDGIYTVKQQVQNAEAGGLDWMVITDHGNVAHTKFSVDSITPEIVAARRNTNVHVYQGLEWNVPGAEHATVILPPLPQTPAIIKQFEALYDTQNLLAAKRVTGINSSDGAPFALEGLKWLDAQVKSGAIPMALMFANHPARKGIDSPSEIRAYRDTAPDIAMGWEGAPGHQATAHPDFTAAQLVAKLPVEGRGYYGNNPGADSWPGYAPTATENSYRTYGGYDFYTAKVGGLWDSLLAEGKPWWITANSDSHNIYDTLYSRPKFATTEAVQYNTFGTYGPPVLGTTPIKAGTGDFAPGAYSRTIVGSQTKSYLTIMQALKAGNILTAHGGLISGADIRVSTDNDKQGVTTGGRTFVSRGGNVKAEITVTLASVANNNGSIPKLKLVQLISGPVTGPVTDKDTVTAPQTKVTETFTVNKTSGTVTFTYTWKNVSTSFYLRYRGSDGGNFDSKLNGPAMDTVGNSNPWTDLWFYTNPVFVDVI